MKKDIRPDCRPLVCRDVSTGYSFLTHSTVATRRTIQREDGKEYPPLTPEVLSSSRPLSGSSARKLRRAEANLLPGRVHVHRMHPLLASELGEDFDLDRVLAHGTLPGIYAERDRPTREADLRSYADTYLREEVQAEALVRHIGGFGRLLDLVAASSGRILNVQALSRDAGLGYETTRRYIDVLEDTLVVFRVPAWSGSSRASLVRRPRLFLFDIGVRNALLQPPAGRAAP